ncbi:hypothetical protein [Nocardia arthritidis]|uniref:Uncharacterized protein n=1 Tax=Nocardia arthritidis TaxID=228602 RepID=A0A6G9YML3_9NOCA|nr:hypothetical protein [Nocardia arthritidis]QIS14448.1 hypothetical protein F5544_33055 [Nocardia arthritidis]
MNSKRHSRALLDEIERQLLGVWFDVCWSPLDSAYLAFSVEFPALTVTNALSPSAAIDTLDDKIRKVLLAEANHRTRRSTSTAISFAQA